MGPSVKDCWGRHLAAPPMSFLTELRLLCCYSLTDAFLLPVLTALPKLRVLSLDRCKKLGDDAVAPALPQLSDLCELELGGTRCSYQTFATAGRHNVNLKSVDVSGLWAPFSDADAGVLFGQTDADVEARAACARAMSVAAAHPARIPESRLSHGNNSPGISYDNSSISERSANRDGTRPASFRDPSAPLVRTVLVSYDKVLACQTRMTCAGAEILATRGTSVRTLAMSFNTKIESWEFLASFSGVVDLDISLNFTVDDDAVKVCRRRQAWSTQACALRRLGAPCTLSLFVV